MFISIIIPVFNVEKYLRQCLDSVLSCSLTDAEIILVTGNSTDGSNAVCEEYRNRFPFVTVIRQDDTGLSDARNCGMKIARGDYVAFLDSDDYIVPERFRALLAEIREEKSRAVSVFVCDFTRVADSGRVIKKINQIENSEKPIYRYEYLQHFLRQKECFWNVWRYVYRRDFLLQNNFFFRPGFLSEDIDYTINVLLKAKGIAFFHNPYYCYRIGRADSLMGRVSTKRVRDTIIIIEDCVKRIQNSSDFPYRTLMTDKLLFEYVLNMATIYEVPKEDKQAVKKMFLESKYILAYNSNNSVKLVHLFIRMTGINFTSFCLVCLKKGKRAMKRLKTGR